MDDGRMGAEDFGPGKPQEVAEGIYRLEVPLPGNPLKAVNSYVIKGRPRNLIIDTGMRRSECREVMAAGLDALGVSASDTDFFITHFHADHLGLVSDIAAETSTIYLNRPEIDRILSIGWFESRFEASARLNGFPEEDMRKAIDRHPARLFGPRLPLHFTPCHDGEAIHINGCDFRCIEVPGHSFGHTCLYDEQRKILISGDHILADITPNLQGWFPDWNPLAHYLKSLDKVAALDVELVLPGHGDVFSDMLGRIGELKAHHAHRAEEVLAALLKGQKTAYRVASEITWDIDCDSFDLFPLAQKWFALGETLAHLIYLESEGRVRREIIEDDGRQQALWQISGQRLPAHRP